MASAGTTSTVPVPSASRPSASPGPATTLAHPRVPTRRCCSSVSLDDPTAEGPLPDVGHPAEVLAQEGDQADRERVAEDDGPRLGRVGVLAQQDLVGLRAQLAQPVQAGGRLAGQAGPQRGELDALL